MRDREREAETQAEGEAGSMQGAWRRTQSRVSRIMPWAKGRCSTIEPPRRLRIFFFFFFDRYNRILEMYFLFLVISFFLSFFFFKDFIYLFMRDTEREAETQAEGEAGSMQGA